MSVIAAVLGIWILGLAGLGVWDCFRTATGRSATEQILRGRTQTGLPVLGPTLLWTLLVVLVAVLTG